MMLLMLQFPPEGGIKDRLLEALKLCFNLSLAFFEGFDLLLDFLNPRHNTALFLKRWKGDKNAFN